MTELSANLHLLSSERENTAGKRQKLTFALRPHDLQLDSSYLVSFLSLRPTRSHFSSASPSRPGPALPPLFSPFLLFPPPPSVPAAWYSSSRQHLGLMWCVCVVQIFTLVPAHCFFVGFFSDLRWNSLFLLRQTCFKWFSHFTFSLHHKLCQHSSSWPFSYIHLSTVQ